MQLLKQIENILQTPLEHFRQAYHAALACDVPAIHSIGEYLYQNQGKQLRPLLVMLSTGASGNTFDDTEQLSVAIELLHNSTLLHDDVVDESDLRRGKATVRKLFGNKTAVLCGDYFLAKVMLILNEYDNKEVNRIIDHTVMEMSTGEILQQRRSIQQDHSIEGYLQIIYSKTATLMAACTELGALSTPWRTHLRNYGKHFGMAFQMRDDLMDYLPSDTTGKPTGNDIKEHKMTLPLLRYMQQLSTDEQEKLLSILHQEEIADADIAPIVEAVHHSSALQQVRDAIQQELQKAKEAIQALPDTIYKKGLEDMSQFLLQEAY